MFDAQYDDLLLNSSPTEKGATAFRNFRNGKEHKQPPIRDVERDRFPGPSNVMNSLVKQVEA